MKGILLTLMLATLIPTFSSADDVFTYTPIDHASFVLQVGDTTVYVDPVGSKEKYTRFPAPDLILITHTHGDHLAPKLLSEIKQDNTQVIGPATAIKKLGYGTAINNGDTTTLAGLKIEAVPAYNITKDRLNFHPKGRDNGYVISKDAKRLYISGDTEDIPEMRALKDIDIAFICMNLPYTMTIEQAASAVNAFKPKIVIPYHYRGKGGMSDIDAFEKMVPGTVVEKLMWY